MDFTDPATAVPVVGTGVTVGGGVIAWAWKSLAIAIDKLGDRLDKKLDSVRLELHTELGNVREANARAQSDIRGLEEHRTATLRRLDDLQASGNRHSEGFGKLDSISTRLTSVEGTAISTAERVRELELKDVALTGDIRELQGGHKRLRNEIEHIKRNLEMRTYVKTGEFENG